jgi:long-chain acyl-CoA synthetase
MALRHKSLQPYMYKNGSFSVEVPGVQKKEGETIPRRHPAAKDGLISTPDPEVRTVYDLVRRGASKFGNAKAMGSRKVIETHNEKKMVKKVVEGQVQEVEKTWTYFQLSEYNYISFTQYEKLVEQLASGLRKVGLSKGDRLHLYAATR